MLASEVRRKEFANRRQEAIARLESAQRELNRLETKAALQFPTLLVLEEDSDGTEGLSYHLLLESLKAEIDDAPENLNALIDTAVRRGELETHSKAGDPYYYVTRRVFASLGLG